MILVPFLTRSSRLSLPRDVRELRVRGTSQNQPALPVFALGAGFFATLGAGARLTAAFGFGALRAVLRGAAAPLMTAAVGPGRRVAAVALPAEAFLAAFLPPPRAARASRSGTACSSVIASGAMSEGRVAFTPSWVT